VHARVQHCEFLVQVAPFCRQAFVGDLVGDIEGDLVGRVVGLLVGNFVGGRVGGDGAFDGDVVGACVGLNVVGGPVVYGRVHVPRVDTCAHIFALT